MKRKIILAISAFVVLGLSIATFAFTRTAALSKAVTACCCCSGDSCPMKTKDTSGKETPSCCDDCDCGKGDSCPMKNKDMKMGTTHGDTDKATANKANCDCPCCHHHKDKEKKAAPAV